MLRNRLKEMLSEGKLPVGHMIAEFATRGIGLLVDAAGADFAIIDMEHSGFGMHQVADLLVWLKASNVTPFVRVPQVEYHFIARVLDAGALGVMVSNVRTAGEAKAIVDAAKYKG